MLESTAKEGDSPVLVNKEVGVVSRIHGVDTPRGKWEATTSNPKYVPKPIVE